MNIWMWLCRTMPDFWHARSLPAPLLQAVSTDWFISPISFVTNHIKCDCDLSFSSPLFWVMDDSNATGEKFVSRSSTLFVERSQILLGEVWCTALRLHKAVLFACPGSLSSSHLLRLSSSGIIAILLSPRLLEFYPADASFSWQTLMLSHGSSLFLPSNSYRYCLDLVSMFQFKWTRTPRSVDPRWHPLSSVVQSHYMWSAISSSTPLCRQYFTLTHTGTFQRRPLAPSLLTLYRVCVERPHTPECVVFLVTITDTFVS